MQVGIVDETQPTDPTAGRSIRKAAPNVQFRRLLEDDAPDSFNFWCIHVVNVDEGADGFQAPRHNHTFQQIKYVVEGEQNIGPGETLHEGELIYVPRGAYYGPQKRETRSITMGIQFGFNGELQRGPYWDAHRTETLDRLNARGKIEGGRYIETDPATGETTSRDAMDALLNERHLMLKGTPLVIPPSGYESPVIMHPKVFPYWQFAPGVELKHLGKFYDQPGPNGDLTISMARLSGGVYSLRSDRPQIAWTTSPGLELKERVCPGVTAVYSPRGEEDQIGGEDGLEVFVVEFARLD